MFLILNIYIYIYIRKAVGIPSEANFPCWWMGIMTNVFTLSSVLWTMILTLLLYSFVGGMKKPLQMHLRFHLLCWGIPLLATLAPLSTSTYGPPGGMGWCWIVPRDDDSTPEWADKVWYWGSYYAWLWLSFLFIFIIFILMIVKFDYRNKEAAKSFKKATWSLIGYPLVILICWAPSTLTDFTLSYGGLEVPEGLPFIATILSVLMGTLSALVFWISDTRTIQNWNYFAQVGFNYTKYNDKIKTMRRSSAIKVKSMKITGSLDTGDMSSSVAPSNASTKITTEFDDEPSERKIEVMTRKIEVKDK